MRNRISRQALGAPRSFGIESDVLLCPSNYVNYASLSTKQFIHLPYNFWPTMNHQAN